jgi:hypothetical protein
LSNSSLSKGVREDFITPVDAVALSRGFFILR